MYIPISLTIVLITDYGRMMPKFLTPKSLPNLCTVNDYRTIIG